MADPQHNLARIGPSARTAPLLQLMREIGGGLPRQGRIARADAFTARPVTIPAGGQAACRIAFIIQRHPRDGCWREGRNWKLRVIRRHRTALRIVQPACYPRHLSMLTQPIGIGDHLPFEITGFEPGKARNPVAVAHPIQPMTGKTSITRPRIRSRQCNQFAGFGQPICRGAFGLGATAEQNDSGDGRNATHGTSTPLPACLFRMMLAALLLLTAAACKGEPEERHEMPFADAARGRDAAMVAGCAACHLIPGIEWPQGTLGPPLHGFSGRTLIAGKLPNRPDILAEYIRNAPALVPGSAMPAMPIDAAQARDIAAFLYQSEGR